MARERTRHQRTRAMRPSRWRAFASLGLPMSAVCLEKAILTWKTSMVRYRPETNDLIASACPPNGGGV